jgi:methyl-accepting chemotaxis protein
VDTDMNDHILHSSNVRADTVMLAAGALCALVCLVTGAATGGLLTALLVGIPASLVPFVLYRMLPGSLVSRLACASAFMVFATLLIQLTGGMARSALQHLRAAGLPALLP